MTSSLKSVYGYAGILLNLPAILVYAVFIASRFAYEALLPLSFLIPDSETLQMILLAGLPFLGMVSGAFSFGYLENKTSGMATILVSAIVFLFTLFAVFIRQS